MTTPSSSVVTDSLTEADRARAVDALTRAQAALHRAMSGLSPEQLTYKAGADRWSIADCMEHIALAETGILKAVKAAMDLPADPDRRSDIHVSDPEVIKTVENRAALLTAPAYLQPTGRFATATDALSAFDQQRRAAIDYVQVVAGNLRTHYFPNQVFGLVDAYQAILMMASHGERHRGQIEEVKTTPGFPA